MDLEINLHSVCDAPALVEVSREVVALTLLPGLQVGSVMRAHKELSMGGVENQ